MIMSLVACCWSEEENSKKLEKPIFRQWTSSKNQRVIHIFKIKIRGKGYSSRLIGYERAFKQTNQSGEARECFRSGACRISRRGGIEKLPKQIR